MYFGLRFCYSQLQLSIPPTTDLPRRFTIEKLEDEGPEHKLLLRQMREDMSDLRQSNLGGKGRDWALNGEFVLLSNTDHHVYVYQSPVHAACSKVNYSQLEKSSVRRRKEPGWIIQSCTMHNNHYRLAPFFLDNRRLEEYYRDEQAKGFREVESVLDELTDVERKIVNHEEVTDSEFDRPQLKAVNNWDENQWSKRLFEGIKKTFAFASVTYGAGMLSKRFDALLTDHLDVGGQYQECFIFQGFPDIIIHRRCTAVASGGASASAGASEDGSDEDSTIENSQRSNLTGRDITAPPEKLGEVFAGLHVLLVAKILRKKLKGKNMYQKFEVKGVLIDKVTATVLCCLSVDLSSYSQPVNSAFVTIKLIDYMGYQLNTDSLCFLIRAITKRGD